jgi:hypothetical protein
MQLHWWVYELVLIFFEFFFSFIFGGLFFIGRVGTLIVQYLASWIRSVSNIIFRVIDNYPTCTNIFFTLLLWSSWAIIGLYTIGVILGIWYYICESEQLYSLVLTFVVWIIVFRLTYWWVTGVRKILRVFELALKTIFYWIWEVFFSVVKWIRAQVNQLVNSTPWGWGRALFLSILEFSTYILICIYLLGGIALICVWCNESELVPRLIVVLGVFLLALNSECDFVPWINEVCTYILTIMIPIILGTSSIVYGIILIYTFHGTAIVAFFTAYWLPIVYVCLAVYYIYKYDLF